MSGITRIEAYEHLQNNTRYTLITGGRGSGKSFAVCLFLVWIISEYQGHKFLFTRYTMTAARISIIPEFEEKINLLGLQADFQILNNEIIHKKTGSQILFRGIKTSSGNQTANLKSLQGVTGWILDEAEELTDESIFDTINLSVRSQYKNRIFLILNPTTKEHWIYKRFIENGKQDNTTYVHTDYRDNIENLPQSFLEEIEQIKHNNPKKYNHVILGGWLEKAEGVIFENWIEGEFDESLPYAFGQDFGFYPDPTTLVKVAVDEKRKRIYCEECCYNTNLSTQKIYDVNYKHAGNNILIVADSQEKRLIAELNKKGLNIIKCQKGKDSVKAGIKDLLDYQLVVTPNSTNLKKELNNYVWSDKKSGIPGEMYNHCIDAIRYAKQKLSTKKKAKISVYA